MRVVGLDLSLTSTGVATKTGATRTITTKLRGVARLDAIWQEIRAVTQQTDLVAIEEYAFHGRDAHSHELGELGGVVRYLLWQLGIPFVAVPIASLKKYATGKGNAGKEEVLAAAIRRLDYEGHSNDEADALWLRAMALDHYGEPVVTMSAEHRKALDAVAWPSFSTELVPAGEATA